VVEDRDGFLEEEQELFAGHGFSEGLTSGAEAASMS
jgi:hypothetical protein